MIFCTQNGITELISDNFFEKYAFNKIGGYSYSWGRSDTQITIDDFAFYSYALGAAERIAETTAVTELFADLGPDATALTGLSGRARDGAERSAEIAVAEGVDLSAEGRKQYIVWLEGQRTPARLTLLTRRLLDYTGEITVDSTDSLPSEVQVTYSDGGTGVASAVWEDYEFSLGRQTVSGRITDASGRTASATLTVTGIEFEWSRAEALFAEIESAGEDAVRSSYEGGAFRARGGDSRFESVREQARGCGSGRSVFGAPCRLADGEGEPHFRAACPRSAGNVCGRGAGGTGPGGRTTGLYRGVRGVGGLSGNVRIRLGERRGRSPPCKPLSTACISTMTCSVSASLSATRRG